MKHTQSLLLSASILLPSLGLFAQDESPIPEEKRKEKSFFVSADFLYWKMQEEGLEFALSGVKGTANANPEPVKKGSSERPDFEWSPGFRAGFAYTIPKQQWQLWLNWTMFNTEGKKTVAHSGDVNVNSLYSVLDHPRFLGGTLVSASAKHHLHYNTLDLSASRDLEIDRWLLLSPHVGIRAAWIHQTYKINTQSSSSSAGLNIQVHDLKFNNDFVGVGLRGGLNSIWFFNSHFGFFGNASFSLISGRFHVHQKMTETLDTIPPGITHGTYVNMSDHFSNLAPELEFAFGLHLEPGSDKNFYRLEIDLGWESLIWFHQNQLYNLTGDSLSSSGSGSRFRGNLNLQGFTASAKLHF
jgi:hypothetical protein